VPTIQAAQIVTAEIAAAVPINVSRRFTGWLDNPPPSGRIDASAHTSIARQTVAAFAGTCYTTLPPVFLVIDLPDSSHFSALLADPRFYAVFAVTVLAGVVRGFSGFGSALIFIPLSSAIYEPRVATASFLLIDFFCTIPLFLRLYPVSNKREVLPLSFAAAVTIPLGAMFLRVVDPVHLRWGIAVIILILVTVLISGWRLRKEPSLPLTIVVGLISGFSGGATQLVGPFAIVYWLGSKSAAAVVRANLVVLFGLTGAVLCIAYFFQGLFPPPVVALSLLLAIAYIVSLQVGGYFFKGSTESLYRRVAYAIVVVAAVVSLPIFDGFIR
jgi:uncharacterized protein